jgi:flagellar hook-associated protein 1 FlgK
MSILSTLFIGRAALTAQQQAIQTTGHNLANVSTPGFSRQRVELSTAVPETRGSLSLGRGVNVDGIRGLVSDFFETQLLNVNSTLGFSQAENRALAGVESAFPTTGGLPDALESFFSALSDLANNPGGQAERVNVIGKATTLGETFANIRSIVANVQTGSDKDLAAAVQRVNDILPQIAKLNKQIVAGEAAGGRANDLRDQRQVLLQQLSSLTGATAQEENDGQVLAHAHGLLLVSQDQAATLDATTFDALGLRVITYRSPNGIQADASQFLTEGEIGGLLTARDTEIPQVLDKLDQLAKTLVDTVNTQHALGFDLNGNPGGDFFAPIAATAGAAAQIQVSGAIVADPQLLAAAQTATGVPGDNRNALALADLKNTTSAALGNTTPTTYLLSIVSDVGSKTQASEQNLNFQNALLQETQARREATSGVSIDEEMTNLILFQRAFQAASVLVRTGDEMYQTILDMVRP